MSSVADKIKTWDAKYIYAVLGVAVLVLFALDALLLMQPQMKGFLSLAKKAAEMQTNIATLKDNVQRMPQLKKQLEDIELDVADFQRMVHRKDDIPMVLKQISAAANETGVKVNQMIPQKDAKELVKVADGIYKSVTIQVMARSGYHEFGMFLTRLENDRVFWKLDEVAITSDAMDPRRPLFKMAMKIVTFEKK